jgi:hypothetical protein
MFKDDLFASNSTVSIENSSMINKNPIDLSPKFNEKSEETISYFDLFTSNEIAPHFIVSFREYLLVVTVHHHYQILFSL